MKNIYEYDFKCNERNKTIRLVVGDLSKETNIFDLVICSAYKGDYIPTRDSFIGGLFWEKNISVDLLSQNPQVDMREQGFWLSQSLASNFKRIGCIEFLNEGDQIIPPPILLKKKYSTMRYVLEQASLSHLGITNIAMPIPGVGEQRIELSYMACVFIKQLEILLNTIEELDEINIYEIREEKAEEFAQILKRMNETQSDPAKVFISYCSKQYEEAKEVQAFIERNGYKCWMAPASIPVGSSYLEEISLALKNIDVLILLLTPDAEASVWVTKEVSTALSIHKGIIPLRKSSYMIGEIFSFMLTDVQIFTEPDTTVAYTYLLKRIKEIIGGGNK